MKHLQNINEKLATAGPKGGRPMPKRFFNEEEDRYMFDPSEAQGGATATFYLHSGKTGFSMDIAIEDRDALEEILKKNGVTHTITVGNELPF